MQVSYNSFFEIYIFCPYCTALINNTVLRYSVHLFARMIVWYTVRAQVKCDTRDKRDRSQGERSVISDFSALEICCRLPKL